MKIHKKLKWSILSLFYSLFFLLHGLHNIDIAQNLIRVELIYDASIVETTAFGTEMSLETTYKIGFISVYMSIFCLFMSGFWFGEIYNQIKFIKT